MAITQIGDIDFNSQEFTDIMQGEFTHRLEFLNSGVLSELPDSVVNNGYTVAMPHWETLSGDSDVISTSLTSTINSLGTYNDVGVWCEREKAWGAEQIVKVVTAADATAEMARQLGQYWANELHKTALKTLTGAFAVALASTHSTGSTYAGAIIDTDAVLAAKLKLGDNSDLLSAALMNSKVYNDALREKIISIDTGGADSYNSGMIPRMLGMTPKATDKLTATSSVYPSYFAAQGSMGYKFRPRPNQAYNNMNRFLVGNNVEVELNRVATTNGGQDQFITRASFVTHVPGVAWAGASTGNPTNTALATGSNWSKVASDDKLIRIFELQTL